MLIFKYQLLHIGGGKQAIDKSLKMYREHMAQYTALADKISKKSKERKAALDEKKATPVIQVLKHRDLAKRIAELTEDLEELRTEKAMLLRQLQYPEDSTADMFRKEIRTLEDGLKKLKASEAKYAAELDNALKQYAELQEQTVEFDPVELYEARQEIRPNHERNATRRIQNAYGDKYDMFRMYDSKRSVANLLNEDTEEHSLREKLRTIQKEQKPQQQKKPKHKDWER